MSTTEQIYYKNAQSNPTSQYNTVKNNTNTTNCTPNNQVQNSGGQQVQPQYNQGYYCYYPPFVPMYQPAVQTQQTQQTQVATVPQPNIQPAGATQMPSQNTYWPQAYSYQPVYYNQPMPNNCAQIPATTAGVNIQIINPAVNAGCPTQQVGTQVQPPQTGGTQPPAPGCVTNPPVTPPTTTVQTPVNNEKKTEKRKIVQLTDDYIRGLENYLNSQNKSDRIAAAKQVVARLEEDDSRANDKALTALINKMLQDPASEVRFLALTALNQRTVTGDQKTADILTKMQNSKASLGSDAKDASNILLKMSGKVVEKEFEVKDEKKPKQKNDLYE